MLKSINSLLIQMFSVSAQGTSCQNYFFQPTVRAWNFFGTMVLCRNFFHPPPPPPPKRKMVGLLATDYSFCSAAVHNTKLLSVENTFWAERFLEKLMLLSSILTLLLSMSLSSKRIEYRNHSSREGVGGWRGLPLQPFILYHRHSFIPLSTLTRTHPPTHHSQKDRCLGSRWRIHKRTVSVDIL